MSSLSRATTHPKDNAVTLSIADREAALLDQAAKHITPDTRAILCYSGGLESNLLLDMLSPWRECITVLHAPCRPIPHLPAYVRRRTAGWRFVELESDPAPWLREHGVPTQVLPLAHLAEFHADRTGPLPTPAMRPANELRLVHCVMPMVGFAREHGAGLVIHGQRAGEGTNWFDPSPPFGLNLWGPLRDWTRSEVAEAVQRRGIELPEHYGEYQHSFECAIDPTELDPVRLDYLRRHYPEIHAEVMAMIGAAYEAADNALDQYRAVLGLPVP